MTRIIQQIVVIIICIAVSQQLVAQSASPTVAVSDLQVSSDNASYAYLGKGFAEIVSFELSKSPQLRLVAREQRNAALKEMDFALSGLADEDNQLKAGKMLSVRYMVYGSVTDMGDSLLVSLKMMDVETGQVVWSDQALEPGSRYARIGASLAKSLLSHFKLAVAKSTEQAAAAETPVKPATVAAVVALSEGIAALDKGDTKAARASLETAARIDPDSALVAALLGKLASASAKFKVVPERYASYWNPAYLGGLERDVLAATATAGWVTYGYRDENSNQPIIRDDAGLWGVGEARGGLNLDYMLPLSPSIGIGTEVIASTWGDSVVRDTNLPGLWYAQEGNQISSFIGATLSAGLALGRQGGLGLGLQGAYLNRRWYTMETDTYTMEHYAILGGTLAALLKSPSGNIAWDIMGSWSTEPQYWFDTASLRFNRYGAPIFVEQTLTFALGGGKAFLALKQVNDIFPDRGVYYLRAMPIVEYWFTDSFAARLGAEGTYTIRPSYRAPGLGGTAGVTLKFGKVGVDLNYTLRNRPSRSLEELVIPESVIFVSASLEGLRKR